MTAPEYNMDLTHCTDIITVQNNFQQFETHVLQQVQAALNSFQQFMGSQADRQKAMYSDISGVASNIPADFEVCSYRPGQHESFD